MQYYQLLIIVLKIALYGACDFSCILNIYIAEIQTFKIDNFPNNIEISKIALNIDKILLIICEFINYICYQCKLSVNTN